MKWVWCVNIEEKKGFAVAFHLPIKPLSSLLLIKSNSITKENEN